MSSQGIYVFLVLILGATLTIITDGETIVVWTQNSHSWTRMRGIYGDPAVWVENEQHTYVGSEPARDQRWNAVGHNMATDDMYWSDITRRTIYRQSVNSSLFERRLDDMETVYSGPSDSITSLAVDWLSGCVYWTDDRYNMIAMTGPSSAGAKNVYKIMFSTYIDKPMGIAVMPDWAKLYWIDAGSGFKIESSSLSGENRATIAEGANVGHALCFTIDHQEVALYWVVAEGQSGSIIKKLSLRNPNAIPENIITLPDAYQQMVSSIAAFQDYIFLANRAKFGLDIYHKHTGNLKGKYIIDATPNHIVVLGPTKPSLPDCDVCDQMCVTMDYTKGKCVCGTGYFIQPDGKTCIEASKNPRYIYSRGQEIWYSNVTINEVSIQGLTLTESLMIPDLQLVQALAFNYRKELLYYADVTRDVIYFSLVDDSTQTELTVNTRHVEGLSVDWQTNNLYWADAELKHIMCSQQDGRYHRIVLQDVGTVRGLSVDPTHGVMFWTSDDDKKSVMTSLLDGTGMRTLVTGDIQQPQGITVDPRQGRIYWVDRSYNRIESVTLSGQSKVVMFSGQAQPMYDVTLYQEYLTWTENYEYLRFGVSRTREYLAQVAHRISAPYTWDLSKFNFDVVSYSNYLQPITSGPCDVDNGGCAQLCFPIPPGDTASTQTKAKCGCAIGYTLSEDEVSCTSDLILSDFLVFADPYHKQVYQMALSGESVQGAPVSKLDFPVSMDIDTSDAMVYWIDRTAKEIKSANIYGNDPRVIWTIPEDSQPERLVVDGVNKLLYFTDSTRGNIGKISIDSGSQSVLIQGLSTPIGLAIDVTNGYLYWTETGLTNQVCRMKTDGQAREVLATDLLKPTAVTLYTAVPNVIYWSEMESGKITMYNVDSKTTRVLLRDAGHYVYALATDGQHVYFSSWSRKAVYRLAANKTDGINVPEIMDRPIFARILDIKAFKGMALPPPAVTGFPVAPVAGAAAAAFLFALLIGLLACCLTGKGNRKKPAAAPDPGESMYHNEEVDRQYANVDNDTLFDMRSSQVAHINPPEEHNNGFVPNGHTNGSASPIAETEMTIPPPPSHPPPAPVPPGGIAVPPGGVASVLAAAGSANKIKKKKGRELAVPTDDPNFVIHGNQKVATVINRLANRLRNGLSSIRWSGDDKRKSGSRHSQEDGAWETEGEDASNVDMGPNQNKEIGKKKHVYEPQLHRPPRGYAPASHSVPRPVKTTWGRAKHNKMAKSNKT